MDYNYTRNYILYEVVDESNEIVYIGSSELRLAQLEFNHRNFRLKGYRETQFRKALEEKGNDWKFEILHTCTCTRERIEYLEGLAIREARPEYNVDLYPYESSKYYGRIA